MRLATCLVLIALGPPPRRGQLQLEAGGVSGARTSPGVPVRFEDFAVQVEKEAPPADVPELVRKELGPVAFRVLRDGTPFLDLWLRGRLPISEPSKGAGILYGWLRPTGLVGVARFHVAGSDSRAQKFPAGVYSLRYALQPDDGDHQGLTDSRDFLLMVSAGADPDPGELELKALIRLSARLHGNKHPGVLSLVEGRGGQPVPRIVRDSEGRRVILEVEAAGPGGKGTGVSIVISGKAAE